MGMFPMPTPTIQDFAMPRFFAALQSLFIGFALVAGLSVAHAKDISPAEREQFESVIRDYLLKNPEVIQEAMAALQKKQEDALRMARLSVIEDKNGPLFTSPASVSIGNPKGDITIVEFFDYNCGYCKKGLPDIQKIVETDKNVRVVLRDFPILAKESQEASVVAMALKAQVSPEKFWDFHVKLMSMRGKIGKDEALDLARESGANMDRLAKDMTSDAIRGHLTETMEIAQKLDISGTPSYVLGDEVVVGAVGYEELTNRIASLRKCGKSVCG
jgi:protein-disulfide isomerase